MEKVDITELNPVESAQTRESVSDQLNAADFSLNYYTLDAGEDFAGSLHAHLDQEESFFILEGEATFETAPDPTSESKTVTVSAGEMIRFEPGEYQQGRNESDEPLRALALGTPQESSDIRVAMPCQACEESDYLAFELQDGEPTLICPECSTVPDF